MRPGYHRLAWLLLSLLLGDSDAHARARNGIPRNMPRREQPLGSVDFGDLVAGEERWDVCGVAREFAVSAVFGVVCHWYAVLVAKSQNGQPVARRRFLWVWTDSAERQCCVSRRR